MDGVEGLTLEDSRTVSVQSQQQLRTMDGSTEKFIENMTDYLDYYESRIRISVEGFNPSTGPVELYKSLEVLFKTCGEVDDIKMEIDPVTRQLTSTSCVVYLRGEGAEQRAPLLDGSELGGKKLRVTHSPLESTDGLTTAARAARKVAEFQRSWSEVISITGYDPSLPQDALKSALRKHFAPCGEITDILIFNSHALVYLYGLGSVQRAIQLDGSDLGGGFNLSVQDVTYQNLEADDGTSYT